MAWLERTYTDLSRPLEELGFTVDATEAGQRVDAVLRGRFGWRSRTHFQRLLREGRARLNGRRTKAAARVQPGDRVTVAVPEDPSAPTRERHDDLVFLHEDEDLAAIDKPSGMAVHPAGRTRHGTLINKLHARYRHPDPEQDVVPRLGHRLDRDTSGIVLVVKNRATDVRITEAFTARTVRKTYLALVEGVPAGTEGVVDAPIGPAPEAGTALHMAVKDDGLPSRSRWRLVEAFSRHALLALEPETGRTHQLRVHLAHLGHPIVCDHLYGDLRPLTACRAAPVLAPDGGRVLLDRLGLHAHRLVLDHPRTGEPLAIESPLPSDLVAATHGLRALAEERR